jgi:hypothetical protein
LGRAPGVNAVLPIGVDEGDIDLGKTMQATPGGQVDDEVEDLVVFLQRLAGSTFGLQILAVVVDGALDGRWLRRALMLSSWISSSTRSASRLASPGLERDLDLPAVELVIGAPALATAEDAHTLTHKLESCRFGT